MGLARVRSLVACVAVAGILVGALPSGAFATSSAPRVSAPSAFLMTMDGTELWSRNSDDKRSVASTIKLLNALVVLENANLDDTVVVSHKAVVAVEEGGVGLVGGQKLTVRQLMTMMLVASANDAAEILAYHVAGSESKYVGMMNDKAKELGLTNTRAVDPHGLGKKGRSSAADLAVIARELMAYPEMREIVLKKKVAVPGPKGSRSFYSSTDKLLGRYWGIEGIKTGFTNPAGYCFVGAAKRGDTELVGVVLGASSNDARFDEMRKLLDWGFDHYCVRRLVSDEAPIGVVAVGRAGEATVSVRPADSFSMVETVGSEPASVTVTLPPAVYASVWRGQQLGLVEVRQAGSIVATIPLLAEAAVSDPAVRRPAPVKKEEPPEPPPGAWERTVRWLTNAMGTLSLRLSGSRSSAR